MTNYVFQVDHFSPIEGKPSYYSRIMTIRVAADTYEAALAEATQQVPTGHRIMAWFTDERVSDDDE